MKAPDNSSYISHVHPPARLKLRGHESSQHFLFRTFSGQFAVPMRGMTGNRIPRRPVARCESPRQEQSTVGKNPLLTAKPAGQGLCEDIAEIECCPSTLAALPSWRDKTLAATARAAASQSKADQREMQTWHQSATQAGPSGHGWPPSSMPRMTKRQRSDRSSSG